MILSILPIKALTKFVIISGIAKRIVSIIVGRFSTNEIKSLTPASIIKGIESKIVVTKLSIILGITATIFSIIVGSASTKLTNRSIPASIICGIEQRIKSTIEVISSGSAFTSTGIASINPAAKPLIIFNATATTLGKFSTNVLAI